MRLTLSPELSFPLDAVTQTFAFLAKKGAGKSYGAQKLCEEMVGAGAQVVILDPVGNWFGLRLGADGRSKGLSIPVFGGLRGDIPLEPQAGALVADLVVDKGLSAVLDVSMFRKADRKRFATAFGEQLFHRKKEKRSPVHLFIEEAQVFVPQVTREGDEPRMLGAYEDIVKLGRNFGIGATMISQRPQAVNKEVLSQTECLIVLQTNGAHERKAIREWIVDQGMNVPNLVEELPALKKGQAWVWSPSWLGITKKVQIGKKKTFDASKTPELGKVEAVRELAPVDLAKIRDAMATVIKEAEQKDPAVLRRRIAELEKELAKRPSAKVETKTIEVPVFRKGEVDDLDGAIREVNEHTHDLSAMMKKILDRLNEIRSPSAAAPPPRPALAVQPRRPAAVTPAVAGGGELAKGEAAVLTACAQDPAGVTREQLTVLTGYKRSTRDAYIHRLGAQGFVRQEGDRIFAEPAGVGALGAGFRPLPTGDELREHWLSRLPDGERRTLEVVVAAYPQAVDRDRISEATGYKRSTRDAYIHRLSARRLVESQAGKVVRASDLLFGPGRAA